MAGDAASSDRDELLAFLLADEGIELADEGIARRDRSQPAVLSYAQERMWFLEQLGTDQSSLGIHGSVAMYGTLDVDALERGLKEIVRRHEVLRTTIVVVNGEPRPNVLPPDAVRLRHVDADGDEDTMFQVLATEAKRRFDLEHDAPISLALIRVSDDHHVLSTLMHHVASDGSSFDVFSRELSTLYTAFVEGKQSPLPELAVQYEDYAAWQRHDASDVFARQLDYWRQQLVGPLPAFEIPTDFARPARQSFNGAAISARLPGHVVAGLEALCKRSGATMFMTLLAAFEVVTSRHAGETDVLIGTPIAGRVRLEIEPLIGAFLNTLVMRNDLADGPTFSALLDRVRTTCVTAYANQDVPFELLLADLQPVRDLSRTPLFQIFFNMTHLDPVLGSNAPSGLRTEQLASPGVAANFDLTMYVNEAVDGFTARLVYNRGLYEPAHMEELVEQYQHLLAQIAVDPDRCIDDYSFRDGRPSPMLPDATAPLDSTWQGSVPDAIRAVAESEPSRVSVVAGSTSWTCGVIAGQMERLATWLHTRGIGRGDVVAIHGHRTGSLVWTIAGVLASGASYVLLDSRYPASRLAQLIRIARPTAWLALAAAGPTPPEVVEALDAVGADQRLTLPEVADVAELEALLELSSADIAASPTITIGPDDPACLTFTSGSTGLPKAVVGRHGSLTHFLPWMSDEFDIGSDDRFSMLSGLSHDPLQRDIFWPLWLGATIVVPDPDLMGSPGYLAAWMRTEAVTVAHLTPAMGRLVTEHAGRGAEPNASLDALRVALFIGDVLTRGQASELRALAPTVSVVNLYGTTETQRASGFHIVNLDEPAADGPRQKEVLPLGRGMPGGQLLVRTASGRSAAIGEVGEIVMRSAHLALGYHDDAELSALRFQPDPNATTGQLYATGDRGRYRHDGSVEFLGRNDDQVQLRGFRIELGEIAATVRSVEAVDDAVVVVHVDNAALPRLVAYVVPRRGESIDVNGLTRSLRSLLPTHMVPSDIIAIERIPLNPNGKLDRAALPAPFLDGDQVAETEPPRDPLEVALVDIWERVLDRQGVGIHQDFFSLGGHSLLATRVLAVVEDELETLVPVSALFENPTVAELAATIREGVWSASNAAPVVPVERLEPIAVSNAQHRLLFMHRFADGLTAYNLPLVLRLAGDVDVAALRWSFAELLKRHESLRTDFEATEDGWNQVVVDASVAELAWIEENVRGGESAALERVHVEVAQPFDLESGPKLRGLILGLDADDHAAQVDLRYLAVTFHHIAVDGWSIRLLLGEIVELYASRVEGRAAQLSPLSVQFLDFTVWQRNQLDSGSLAEGLSYWTSQLGDGLPVLDLPGDRPRPPVQSYSSGTVHAEISGELLDLVRSGARKMGVTPFNFLLAGYVATLARWSGQDDFVVGTAAANRGRPELDNVVGMFVNTLALRTRVDADAPFADLLGEVKQVLLGAFAHEAVPFDRIVEAIKPARDLSRSIVFQTLFVLNNLPVAEGLGLSGVEVEPVAVSNGSTEQDLSVAVVELSDRALVRADFNTDVFDEPTIERFLDHWQRLLASAANDPTKAVAELSMLAPHERTLLAGEWANGPVLDPVEAPRLDRLVADAAALRPDAIAVVCGEVSLTYTELVERSGRLARVLADKGVQPGRRVGVAVERSAEMIVSLLAVLQTGAAYVPLDPEFPTDRLAFMVSDAELQVVIVSDGSLDGRLDTSQLSVIDVIADAPLIANADPTPLAVDTSDLPGGGVAYVIYTSGSTGVPKGVEIEHASVVNFVRSMITEPGFDADDVLLAVTTLSFDISVLEMFVPLSAGGRTVVATRDEVVDGRRLAELITLTGTTVMQATPTTWSMLFESGWTGARDLTVLCGGEAMPVELGRRLVAECGPVWNMFGPTETTIWSTVQSIDESALEAVNVPIGRPIANTVVRVLDDAGELSPVGVPGELFIGGAGVARGYLNRPELNTERFVNDGFSASPNDRLYRTGDLARWLPNGTIEFLGRLDHQVKVRGHRIELGEVESALRSHPAVADVVVVADGQASAGRLLAYPIYRETHAESAPLVGDLRSWLGERVPNYMIPSLFIPVESFPLTPNRKIDRARLPSADEVAAPEAEFVAPRNDIERIVAGIIGATIGVEQVGVNDNFFELGGHSLHATTVIATLENTLGATIDLRTFFTSPTVAGATNALLAAAPDPVRVERVARLRVQLADMSPEEVSEAFAERSESVKNTDS